MFSKSKRFGDNIHGASGPGPAAYTIKRLFDDAGALQPKQRARRALQPKQRARKPQVFPSVFPMLLGNLSKPPCEEPLAVEPPPTKCNDWSKDFACKGVLAEGATGKVLFGTLTLKQETPVTLKRILKTNFDEKMVHDLFREFKIMNSCNHPNIAKVFSAYEVPLPAFMMELLGKTLDQSTTQQAIDNDGVLAAFEAAAAAVQYLHSIKIAHRDIKPHNLCHPLHCDSWEVKLIDFDAAEEIKDVKDCAQTCPATVAYAPTGTDALSSFNEWKTWTMADLDIFALGKTFQEIVFKKGWALTEPFKEEFRTIQEQLLHRNQDLQQALEDAQAAGIRQRVP